MTSPRSSLRLPRLFLVAAVMLAAFAYPSAASADTLYAVNGGSNNLASLHTLNPSTGASTPVGPITIGATQQTNVTGLAVRPTDGALYGFKNAPTNDRSDPTFENGTLLAINKATGAATAVGSIGAAGPLRASDITFDRFGNLYAWSGGCSGTDGCNSNGSDLYTLNTTTGTSTKVSESGTYGFQTGLASDSRGRMYMKSYQAVFRVNPQTGHVFAAQGFNTIGNAKNVLSFGPGDTLYTADFSGNLLTLNPSTGTLTTMGYTGLNNISAIDWDFTTPTQPDEADLSLDNGVSNAAPAADTNVTFTLTLGNAGSDSATGVMVKDLLPSGFTYVSHTASAGTYAPGTGLWNLGTVANAAAPTLQIVATVLSTGVHTNTAEVVDTTTYDTDSTPGSGQGDTFESARSAPVGATALYAVTGAGPGFCGGSPSYLYELDPSNATPSKVADITIGGNPVTHVTGLSVHPADGTLYGFMGFQGSDCELSDGESDGTLITINKTTGAATVVGSTGIGSPDMTFNPFGSLYAWGAGNAAGTQEDDLYTLNTTTGASTKVGECGCFSNSTGLAFDSLGRLYEKSSSQLSRMNQFTGQRFSSVFLNQSPHNMLAFGPSDALYTGRRQDDTSGFNFTLMTITLPGGPVNNIGTNSVFNISALAWDLGTITPPNQVDLSLTKTSDITSPDDWTDQVTFTVTLTNNDLTESATGVQVKDLLPSGFTYVSNTPSTGTYTFGTGIWNVGTVAANDSETLEIVVTSNPNSASRTNVAEVVDSTTYDPDSVPGSGDSLGDTYASKTITPTATPGLDAAADVIVSGPSKATATSKAFTVKITNVGTANFTATQSAIDATVNGSSVVTCSSFSQLIKPGRSYRAKCSANLASLALTPPAPVTYEATVDVPGDGFTLNDSSSSGPRPTS
jgi:uncharacterized repeat protein (TIGR01451 family)